MTGLVEFNGLVSAGPLTVADMSRIDLEAPFEISDGRLEIMTPPSFWHQYATREVERILEKHYPYVTSDVTLAVGDNGRRPDAIALPITCEEILEQRIKSARPDMVEVAVEVISHDEDQRSDLISVTRDREIKFREYATAGIPEYWLVDEIADDPQDALVEIYHLHNGRYSPVAVLRLSDLTSGRVDLPSR